MLPEQPDEESGCDVEMHLQVAEEVEGHRLRRQQVPRRSPRIDTDRIRRDPLLVGAACLSREEVQPAGGAVVAEHVALLTLRSLRRAEAECGSESEGAPPELMQTHSRNPSALTRRLWSDEVAKGRRK